MTEVVRLRRDRLPTPVGPFLVVADDEGRLRAAGFADHEERLLAAFQARKGRARPAAGSPSVFRLEDARDPAGLTTALAAYFAGDLAAIDGLAVETGGTPFQRSVWEALRTIPCGTTVSYSQLAHAIGRPSAVRAVGLANGANPVSIVVPCHRVIGADGTLTGYGGGMPRKRWLLTHEAGRGTAPLFPGLFTAPSPR